MILIIRAFVEEAMEEATPSSVASMFTSMTAGDSDGASLSVASMSTSSSHFLNGTVTASLMKLMKMMPLPRMPRPRPLPLQDASPRQFATSPLQQQHCRPLSMLALAALPLPVLPRALSIHAALVRSTVVSSRWHSALLAEIVADARGHASQIRAAAPHPCFCRT